MQHIFLVGLGGCLGSIARYKLSGLILHHTLDWRFPWGTFVVNVVGCVAAGLLAGLVERHDRFSSDARIFLFAGVLGGFTTFSAFGADTVFLLRRGDVAMALGYVASSVLCGFSALWLFVKIVPRP